MSSCRSPPFPSTVPVVKFQRGPGIFFVAALQEPRPFTPRRTTARPSRQFRPAFVAGMEIVWSKSCTTFLPPRQTFSPPTNSSCGDGSLMTSTRSFCGWGCPSFTQMPGTATRRAMLIAGSASCLRCAVLGQAGEDFRDDSGLAAEIQEAAHAGVRPRNAHQRPGVVRRAVPGEVASRFLKQFCASVSFRMRSCLIGWQNDLISSEMAGVGCRNDIYKVHRNIELRRISCGG